MDEISACSSLIIASVASQISLKLNEQILLVMPTAMPRLQLHRIFGNDTGRSVGSCMELS